MKIDEAVYMALMGNDLSIRRESWTHGDALKIKKRASYMGGELFYRESGSRAELFYVADLIADDWEVENHDD